MDQNKQIAKFKVNEIFYDIPTGGNAIGGYLLEGEIKPGMFIIDGDKRYLIKEIDSYDHKLSFVTATDRDIKEDVPLNVGLRIDEKIKRAKNDVLEISN